MALKDLVVHGPMPKAARRHIPKKMKLEPTVIDGENWFYDEKRGIRFVHEVRNGREYIRTDQILIPWRIVHEASERRREFIAKHDLKSKHGKRKN